jgi:hypothetical protein
MTSIDVEFPPRSAVITGRRDTGATCAAPQSSARNGPFRPHDGDRQAHREVCFVPQFVH